SLYSRAPSGSPSSCKHSAANLYKALYSESTANAGKSNCSASSTAPSRNASLASRRYSSAVDRVVPIVCLSVESTVSFSLAAAPTRAKASWRQRHAFLRQGVDHTPDHLFNVTDHEVFPFGYK